MSVMKSRSGLSIVVGCLMAGALLPVSASATLSHVTLKSDEAVPAPRWMFAEKVDPKALATLKGLERDLAEAKAAQINADSGKCLDRLKSARAKVSKSDKGLGPWISVMELDCARGLDSKASGRRASVIETALRNPSWFAGGAHLSALRAALSKSVLELLEQDVKTNRARVWQIVDKLQPLGSVLDDRARGRVWRFAGEAAFAEHKQEAAIELLKRALAENDNEETRAKLAQMENSLQTSAQSSAKTSSQAAAPSTSTPVEKAPTPPDSSREETELVERATGALKRGELVPAVDDAITLIKNYPGSSRAKWATDRVIESYNSVADKNDSKSQAIRGEIVARMENADGDRLAEWARLLYNRGQWEDSHRLGSKALSTIDGARRTKVLETAAEAAIATDRFDVARDRLMELVEKHSGTPSMREALLRLGMLHFRMGNTSQAQVALERLLVLPQMENLEVTARYWLWRVLQKTKSQRADFVADELMKKFPFSYYGLRARYERNGGVLEWKPETSKLESKIWMTAQDRATLDRARALLKSGWLEEAQAELKDLPPALRAEDKAVRSLLWAAAMGFVNASKLANEAWDEKQELRRPPFTTAAFPNEFDSIIEAQATARKLNKFLVKGLIKQESGFNARATSGANALGLMQMIPGTAREIAGELKLGSLSLPEDMFQPSRNIQMGTHYIAKMLGRYQGHVPLALAAYNAGPSRIDKWIRSRPSLKDVATSRSGKPEDEIWFDEIPYSETSFYVKAIMRNILLYRMFEQGKVEVPEPVWAF